MSPIRTVLFDLDGTLIDSIQLILDSYHHTLAAHGLPPRSDNDWLEGVGTPLRVQLRRWADSTEQLDRLVATYREYNLANHDRMVTVYPGVPEMVRAVRATGRRTGVVTSKTREGTLRGLRRAGLESEIELIVGADDVERPKPHPEPVLRAMNLLGADPASTVYVGDSIHDMHSGRAAGVRTAAVLWGPFSRADLAAAEPDTWLAAPGDLIAYLNGLRA